MSTERNQLGDGAVVSGDDEALPGRRALRRSPPFRFGMKCTASLSEMVRMAYRPRGTAMSLSTISEAALSWRRGYRRARSGPCRIRVFPRHEAGRKLALSRCKQRRPLPCWNLCLVQGRRCIEKVPAAKGGRETMEKTREELEKVEVEEFNHHRFFVDEKLTEYLKDPKNRLREYHGKEPEGIGPWGRFRTREWIED